MAEAQDVVVDATIGALRRHAPFDRMDADSLAYLAREATIAYFPKGRRVVGPEQGAAMVIYIVQRGHVRGEASGEGVPGLDAVEIGPGECFPLAEVVGMRPAAHAYDAAEDSFCYEVKAPAVAELARRSREFQKFCVGSIGALLQQSQALVQSLHAQRATGQLSMGAPLRDLVRRAPVTCAPEEPLKSALARMREAKVGAIVAITPEGEPAGVFTERDLLHHMAGSGLDASRPVRDYMTHAPSTLPGSASAAEAALLMARRGFRHVPVVEEGRLVGMVSERDLFALQRTSMRSIVGAIERAGDEAALKQAAADIARLAENLIAQGVGAEHLAQLVATLNDRLVARVLEVEAARHDLGGLEVCWIALGSEGRYEQTLATDQDNGIVFAGEIAPDEARARLLPFAQAANQTLDACGFPLCKGEIMAGNPQWCLSADEWRARFTDWIRNPVPQALLNATIFFDLRALWGADSLASSLRGWLAEAVKGNDRFLRAMTQSALESRAPGGLLGGLLAAARTGDARFVDLKASGTRPFVDAARILALASGIEHTNTAARLRAAGPRLRMPNEEVEAMAESFHFVLLLRLRHQMANPGVAGAEANRIDPDSLNELDRRILREAMRQARKLQDRLALDYRL